MEKQPISLNLIGLTDAHTAVDRSVTGQELNLLSSYKFKYMLSAYVRGNAIKI